MNPSEYLTLRRGVKRLSLERWHVAVAVAVALAVVGALWWSALPLIDVGRINDLGLFPALPPAYFIAMALLCVTFAVTLHLRQTPDFALAAQVVAILVIIHGTLPLVYDAPRYAWTYKHLGVTSFIQQYGVVDPGIDIYHNWPAFFAVTALFTDMAGLASPALYSNWAQLFFNVIDLAALVMIFRALTDDRRVIWLSAWLFALTNWVAQDYYAPQAFAYTFHLIALGILLTWFREGVLPSQQYLKRWLHSDRLVDWAHHGLTLAVANRSHVAGIQPRHKQVLMGIIILCLCTIVTTHPLTPFMTLSSLIVIAITRQISARRLPILMAGLTISWTVYAATTFLANTNVWYASFLQVANVESNVHDISNASAGQVFVIWIARLSSAFVWVLGAFGALRRIRRRQLDLAAVVLALIPFPMLAVQSYGGEMIYRIYLFALPWMVFFAATLVYPRSSGVRLGRSGVLNLLLSGLLLACLQFSYFGQEQLNHLTRREYEASQHLYQAAPKGSTILALTWNYPSRFVADYDLYHYANYFEIHENEASAPPLTLDQLDRALVWLMDRYNSPEGYYVLSRGQQLHSELRGIFPASDVVAVENELAASARVELVYSNADVQIYRLVRAQTAAP